MVQITLTRTIIYPVGNSQLADKAREQAAYLSKTTGSRLVLLYVDEKISYNWCTRNRLTRMGNRQTELDQRRKRDADF
jgi:hypothetical protein